MVKFVTTILLTLFMAAPACAETAREMIEDFFAGMDTLAADFTQAVLDADGRKVEESSGRVYLALPEHFRWDYSEPYEQYIVADGEKVWVYDVDLEQVTVRDQQQAAQDSPLMVLSDTDLMDRYFHAQSMGLEDGLRWLRLTPKKEDSEFVHVEAGVDDTGLRALIFIDRFNQQTVLTFSNLEVNAGLDPDMFGFAPPEGVDVIGDVSSQLKEQR